MSDSIVAGVDANAGTHAFTYNGSNQLVLDTWTVAKRIFVKAFVWSGTVKVSETDWVEIVVTGSSTPNGSLTAKFQRGSGTVQWTRTLASGGGATDIADATALAYAVKRADRGYVIGIRVTSFVPEVAGIDVPFEVPAAPVMGAVSAGIARVSAAYTAPPDDGGKPVSRYDAQLIKDGVPTASLLSVENPVVFSAVHGVRPGEQYGVTVRANNAIGAGPYSAVSSLVTAGGAAIPSVPGQPAKPVLTAMAGAVSLAWVPGAAGSTVTTGNVWTDINGNVMQLTANPQTITAPAGTPYTGTVTTLNAQGAGPASAQADAVTPTAVVVQPFDPATDYATGTQVLYAGNRYQFSAPHPAGNWTGTDVTFLAHVSGVANTWGNYKQLGNQYDYISGTIATAAITAPTTSLGGKLQVEAPWTQARIVSLQKEARYVRGSKFSIASTESAAINNLSAAYDVTVAGVASSLLYNASTAPNGFRPLTWSGQAASPIQTPGAITSPSQGHIAIPSYEFSDIVDSVSVPPASGQRPFLVWREAHMVGIGDQASSTRSESLVRNYTKYSSGLAFGRLALSQVLGSSGDMVADPTLAKSGSMLNPASAGTWPYVIFQLNHSRPVRNLYAAGDSITESYNWWLDAINSISTPAAPFCGFNGGASGDASAQFLTALRIAIRDPRNNITDVLIPSFSPNENTNQSTASMAAYETMIMDLVAMCVARNIRVYIWTSYAALTPRFTGNGTAVAAILAYNQRMRVRAAAADAPFFLIEIEQGWDQATMSTDNTHPNAAAGEPYMRSRVTPGLQRT